MTSVREFLTKLSREGREIFGMLQKRGPLTKNDLLQITGTNLTTLNRIMHPLEEERLVVEVGIGESSGGRKPVLYGLNPKKFYILGIDISRPYTQLIITNPILEIVDKRLFDMDESFTPEKTVKQIGDLFQEMTMKLETGIQLFLGAGLGTVGPLERDRGIMTSPKFFAAPGWVKVPIKNMLEQELKLPVDIDNGANTAILAELFLGEGKAFQNIAYFHCSVGIRTGAISAGTIVRSMNDAEDSFGHMVIDLVNGELCVCGNYGCIECYSSIHAIVREFTAALKRGRISKVAKPLDEINFIDICRAAENGDELAREVIINAATIFGAGLANYINLLNPGLVILNGPLIEDSLLFYEVCTSAAYKRLYSKTANLVKFSKGGCFGLDAIAVGAAAMVVEKYL
jgi:predicted NBD/HSP70 family sugar kinase